MLNNFSWIEEGVIAGSSLPHNYMHFKFLKEIGIKKIINLTVNSSINAVEGLEFIQLPIPDFSIPDRQIIEKYIKIIKEAEKNNEPVLVHCFAGCGRTGTMLAVWLLLKNKVVNNADAISEMRKMRPC